MSKLKGKIITLLACLCVILPMTLALHAEAAASLTPAASDNLRIHLIRNSELVALSDGYMRVFYTEAAVGVEYYDDDFNIRNRKNILMELPVWGGFYASSDAYYLIEGQNNTAESNDAEVIRVIKYGTDWSRKGAASIKSDPGMDIGGEIRYPFNTGCVEVTESGGKLYIVTGHEGYVDPEVGQGHQGYLMLEVDKTTMKGKIVDSDLWHSFAQYIVAGDSELYVLEKSEGSRYTKLTKYDTSGSKMEKESIPVLKYGGHRTSSRAEICYASVDGMALSGNNVLCVGTSIDQKLYDSVTPDTPHNIYLTVTPISDFTEEATQVKWITDYKGDGKSFLGVKLTRVNSNRFMISWEEYKEEKEASIEDPLSASTLHYLFVDGNGKVISKEYTEAITISECQPVVKNGKAVYYASSDNTVDFYSIDTENGSVNKRTYRVAGENATWTLKDGVLTITGTGMLSIDATDKTRYPRSDTVTSYSSGGENAWKAVKNRVKKLVIGEGITGISDNAFNWLPNLTEVELKEGLLSIGAKAFYGCQSLCEIRIPSSVKSLGDGFLDWTCGYWGATIYAAYGSYTFQYAKQHGLYCLVDLSGAKVTGLKESYMYDPDFLVPQLTVTLGNLILKEDRDYWVIRSGPSIGEVTLEISGIGDFAGKITRTINITPADISAAEISNLNASYAYTGVNVMPGIVVKMGARVLYEGRDIEVTYMNNTEVGTASIKVTGIGNYTGSITRTFAIVDTGQAVPPTPSTPDMGAGVQIGWIPNTVWDSSTGMSIPAGDAAVAVGTVLEQGTGIKYRVTSVDNSGNAAVEFWRCPAGATNVSVPTIVRIGGVTYKVTSIAPKAFAGNKKVKKVTIGKSIVSIGARAFYNCKNLKMIIIKASGLTAFSIGAKAFKGISRKAVIKVPAKKLKSYKTILKKKGAGSEVVVRK